MLFKNITEKDFKAIADIQRGTGYNGSEFSFLYLKGWDYFNFDSMQIAIEDDIAILRFILKDKYDEEGAGDWIYLPTLCALDKLKDVFLKIQ